MDNADDHVSVLIPTYKRSKLLWHVLEALTKQTSSKFEVVIVLKPNGDGTEEVIRKYRDRLQLKIVEQTSSYFLEALNLGLDNTNGNMIAFLDDDAIPAADWVQKHVETLNSSKVGGVAMET